MKKLLSLFIVISTAGWAHADTKISAMSSTTTLNSVDIIPVVTNPGTAPANFSISKTNLLSTLDVLTQSSATANFIKNQVTSQSGSTASPDNVNVKYGVSTSSINVTGGNGASVTYGLSIGSMTGAGLSSCSGGTNALTWNSATNTFGCNTISASGGASSLQVTQSGVQITSPTSSMNFYGGDFALLANGTTSMIALNAATTDFIHNQESLQSATLHVSSAGVDGQLNVSSTAFMSNNSGAGVTALCVNTNNYTLGQRFCNNATPADMWGIYNEVDTSGANPGGNSYGLASINNSATIGAKKTTAGWFYAANGATLNYGIEVNSGEASGVNATNYGVSSRVNTLNAGNTGYAIYGYGNGSVGTYYGGYFDASTGGGTGIGAYATGRTNSIVTGNGAIQVGSLSASQLVKSDASKNLVSYDLFNDSPTYKGNQTITSSMTVTGGMGAGVTYGLSIGSMTGAGLTSCSGISSALTWNSSTNLFGCNTIAGSSGGASTLAVFLGTQTFIGTMVSSPTAVVNFDQSQFTGSLQGGATAFMQIAAGVSSISGNFTFGSTSTVVLANCGSACTVTLPTAVGITGRVLTVKVVGTGATSIATTSAQTIDGSTTITPNPNQYASIDVISDGQNWSIR